MTILSQAMICASSILLAGGLVSCADQTSGAAPTPEVASLEAAHIDESREARANRPAKPGASLAFAHTFRFPPQAGQSNVVTITARHPYKSGTLNMRATADDGIALFGLTSEAEFVLSGAGEETWEISFEPDAASLGYINIEALVFDSAGRDTRRSYAVRVDTRDESAKASVNTTPVEEVIMEAEETISE